MTKPLPLNEEVFLRVLRDNKVHDFKMFLNGNLFSRKSMRLQRNGKIWILNHIDNSIQRLGMDELGDTNKTIIGEALEKGALFLDD